MEHFTLYQHLKRPEWGLAIAIAHLVDRRIFMFEGGACRIFMNEYAHFMSEVEPEAAAEATERALQYFSKHAPRANAATAATPAKKSGPRKPSTSPRKKKASASTSKPEPAAE